MLTIYVTRYVRTRKYTKSDPSVRHELSRVVQNLTEGFIFPTTYHVARLVNSLLHGIINFSKASIKTIFSRMFKFMIFCSFNVFCPVLRGPKTKADKTLNDIEAVSNKNNHI